MSFIEKVGAYYSGLPKWSKGVIFAIGLVSTIGITIKVRRTIKNRPPKVNYPQGGEGVPAGWSPEPLAKKAHEAMEGGSITGSSRDATLMLIAQLPTSDMFVAVYDVFNQLYMKEGEGTLREWVEDEWTLSPIIRALLISRFEALKLK